MVYFRSLQFTRLVSLLRSLQLAWSVLCAPEWRRSSYSPPTSSQSYSPTLYRARVRRYLPICRVQTMCYSPLTQLSRGGEMCCSLMDLQLQLREGINHYFLLQKRKDPGIFMDIYYHFCGDSHILFKAAQQYLDTFKNWDVEKWCKLFSSFNSCSVYSYRIIKLAIFYYQVTTFSQLNNNNKTKINIGLKFGLTPAFRETSTTLTFLFVPSL